MQTRWTMPRFVEMIVAVVWSYLASSSRKVIEIAVRNNEKKKKKKEKEKKRKSCTHGAVLLSVAEKRPLHAYPIPAGELPV